MDYPGKVITKNQVTPTQTSASGNWTLDDQAAAIKNNNWPVAGVPNPISKSLRFNSADSAYLNRTPASASNRQTWTWSGWIKFSISSTVNQGIFGVGNSASGDLIQYNNISHNIRWFINGGTSGMLETSQLLRDPSAWYHLVFVFDTTNSTSSDRMRIYVNGTRITSFSTATYPSQNYQGNVNTAAATFIGFNTSYNYLSGYLTEVNFIDGQALTPSSFGMTNPQTGQWIPIKYSGTYGTNGFYLNFKDATSTTTLGYDYSGNANNWTTNNFSVTAGSGNDSLTDVPTPWVAYNTTGDVGGVVRGNYATWNAVSGYAVTLTNGNLDYTTGTTSNPVTSTWSLPTSGKWYWEVTVSSVGEAMIGIQTRNNLAYAGPKTAYYRQGGSSSSIYIEGSANAYNASSYTNGDVIAVGYDADNSQIRWYKNNVQQGGPYTLTSLDNLTPIIIQASGAGSNSGVANFGQRPFTYTPPAGFLSLCSTNLPTPTIGFGLTNQGDDYFNAVLWTGTGVSRNVTGVGFQPDLVWLKIRSSADSNGLFDAVRGAGKRLQSNDTGAEATNATTVQSAFISDGFTVGTDPQSNGNGSTYVAWNWKANGAGGSNTAGTITSTVSANTTSGFSIVTYTGTGAAGVKVGHGLGVAPSMMIVKQRGSAGTNWAVYHASLPSAFGVAGTQVIYLNSTTANTQDFNVWDSNNTESTRFSVGASTLSNANGGTYVAYCFAAVAGYSAFGSYTGNGSTDGPFVFCGFRPRWVMLKRIDTTSDWTLWDTARDPSNVAVYRLFPNLSLADSTGVNFDILSNGFKLRDTGVAVNASGGTYIYAAFAESPFKFANAR